MKRFTLKRNHTNVHIVTRFSLVQVTRPLKGCTPKRNHSNVHIVTRFSLIKVTAKSMKRFTPMINHTNVHIVTRVSLVQVTGTSMKWFTLKRNHTNVHIVTRVYLIQVTRLSMKGFTARTRRRSHKETTTRDWKESESVLVCILWKGFLKLKHHTCKWFSMGIIRICSDNTFHKEKKMTSTVHSPCIPHNMYFFYIT